MPKKLLFKAAQYIKQNHRRRVWRNIVCFLASIVVFCTVYALILPAITLVNEDAIDTSDGVMLSADSTWLTVHNTNYYEADQIILIDGYTVEEFNDPDYNISFEGAGDLTAAAKASFVNNKPTFEDYTAVIIENLDNGNNTGVQFYVDAIITSTSDTIMNPGVTMSNLTPKTNNGFIVYVPNSMVTEYNLPDRGDLITPNFWIWSPDMIIGFNGTETATTAGALLYEDNPADGSVLTTATPVNVNATVNLFDYGESINSSHATEFLFWNGDYGYGADIESQDGWGADFILVDGEYEGAWPGDPSDPATNITLDAYHGYNKYPNVSPYLSESGYPVLLDRTPENLNQPVELNYLFDSTYQVNSQSMTLGGGLFQKDNDGYYYYDSLQNAAHYDDTQNKFILYEDLIVRPWADSGDSSEEAYGNFLPLNEIRTDNITLDGYVFSDDRQSIIGTTGWTGSLHKGAGQSVFSALATLRQTGNNRLRETVYNLLNGTGKFSARLEDKTNLWFGMSVEFDFYQPKDGMVDGEEMIFDFHGDDDVLVYIGVWNEETQQYDYKLTLDLSGAHEARSGNINFTTGEVTYQKHNYGVEGATETIPGSGRVEVNTTLKEIFGLSDDTFHDYSQLSLKFFYLERGGNISYCRLRFNMPTLPNESLTVTKQLDNESIPEGVDPDEYFDDTLTYNFRVVQADADGNATDKSYFQRHLGDGVYEPVLVTYDILEDGIVVGQGTVDETGAFSLKATQSALFYNMLDYSHGNEVKYVVQEILPKDTADQFGSVMYYGGAVPGVTVVDNETSEEYTIFNTSALDPSNTQYIIYQNRIDILKLSYLKITKQAADNTVIDANEEFMFQVKLGGEPVADGTEFLVGDTVITAKTVTVTVNSAETTISGVISLKTGQTAEMVKGVLSGTEYEVREILPDGSGYHATYEGTVSSESTTGYLSGEGGISEKFPLESVVHITAYNADYTAKCEIPLQKTFESNTTPTDFQFDIIRVDENGDPLTDSATLPGTTITVTDEGPAYGKILLLFNDIVGGTYYYKITERSGTESDIQYDKTVYLLEILVEKDTATIVSVNGESYDSTPLQFINRRVTDIVICKKVTGIIISEELTFNFTAAVKLSDGSVFIPEAAEGYTVAEDGTISFALARNETVTIKSLPIGATLTITETDAPGYIVSYTTDGGETSVTGSTATIPVQKDLAVDFINHSNYELPATGGSGTQLYTMAGALLILLGTCLLYRSKKSRGEVD